METYHRYWIYMPDETHYKVRLELSHGEDIWELIEDYPELYDTFFDAEEAYIDNPDGYVVASDIIGKK